MTVDADLWPAPVTAPVVPGRPLWSSTQVCRLTGASYRQLDYWCRMGYIPGQPAGSARGSGNRRMWSTENVRRVRLLLIAARIQHGNLAAVVDWLEEVGLLAPIEQRLHELEAADR